MYFIKCSSLKIKHYKTVAYILDFLLYSYSLTGNHTAGMVNLFMLMVESELAAAAVASLLRCYNLFFQHRSWNLFASSFVERWHLHPLPRLRHNSRSIVLRLGQYFSVLKPDLQCWFQGPYQKWKRISKHFFKITYIFIYFCPFLCKFQCSQSHLARTSQRCWIIWQLKMYALKVV